MNGPTESVKARWTLKERLELGGSQWHLSQRLFGEALCEISDLQEHNYVYLLDNVPSRRELIRGLQQLSPLADDALSIAESLTEQDFYVFKGALAKERCGESGNMPEKFRALVIPKRFLPATIVADEFQVPLGAALVRLMEMEEGID